MLTFLGVLVIVFGLATLLLKPLFKNSNLLKWFNPRRSLQIVLVGIILSIVTGTFFYAEPGTAYAVQYPWGGQKAVFRQGIHTKMWGRLIPIQFELPIKYVIPNGEGDLGEQSEYANVDKAKYWAFSDAVKARIATSVVISINTEDEMQFLSVADRNKTEKNLIRSRIIPNIDQSIKNTCKLMDAQDYISGEASNFDRYFRDQLQNGMYIVEEDKTAPSQGDILGDTTVVRTVGTSTTKQKKFRIKRDSQGNPLRDNKSNSLSQYGIKFVQAQVTEIDWEQSFDERLDKQKNEVALTQLEKQEAERQRYTAQKEIAKAESNKAKRRGELELKQVEETIAAETRSKVAEQDVIAEKKRLEVARLKAQSQKVAADAQAYENQRLVSAGLTPQERAEWDYKTAVGIAREFKELRLPQTYIEGGKNGQGTLLESLIGAEIAKGMLKK